MGVVKASRLAGFAVVVATAALAVPDAGAGPARNDGEATLRLEVAAVGVAVGPPPDARLSVENANTESTTFIDTDDLALPDGTPCPGIVTAGCTIDITVVPPAGGANLRVRIEDPIPGTLPVFSADCRAAPIPEPVGGLILEANQTKVCRVSFARADTNQSGANAIVVVDKTFDFVPSSWSDTGDRFEIFALQARLLGGLIRDDFRPRQAATPIDPDPDCIPSLAAPRTRCEWVAGFADPGAPVVRLVETATGWFPLYGGDCAFDGSLPYGPGANVYRNNLFQCSVENVFLEGGDADADGLLRVELSATAQTNEGATIGITQLTGASFATLDSHRMLSKTGQPCADVGTDLCTGDLGVSIPNGSGNVTLQVSVNTGPRDTVAATYTGNCDAEGVITVNRARLSTCRITLSIKQPVVSVSPVSVVEGNLSTKTVLVPVSLDRPAERTITVPWSTSDGTATAPSDYLSASGSVTFDPGQSKATVPVSIVGDIRGEATESFRVDLGTPGNATLGADSASVTITNDDDTTPPVIAAKADVVVEARLTTGQTIAAVYTSPRAVDNLDGDTAVTCAAKSGSQFPLGRTQVRCSSTDRNFNTGSSTFFVVVRLPTTTGAVSNPGNTAMVLSEVSPGRRVRVTAGGFLPESVVRLVWVTADGDQLAMGSAPVDAAGRFDARPKIPEAAPFGVGQILALGVGMDASEVNRVWRMTVKP
jgi:hypothetical protein